MTNPSTTSQLLAAMRAPCLGLGGDPRATRVVVAMSGGVDSSLVAALLKHQGYDVVGITMQLYDQGAAAARKGACCAGQDIHDARQVAAQLGIPHYVLDYEARFAARVVAPFAASYAAGETPVPCIACNQEMKFADLLDTARDLGAQALATGHYVAVDRTGDHPVLRRAADADRDQSYFLFATTREQLDFLHFPLGDMTKPQVRDMAAALGLPVASKADSQDICFVAQGHYSDLVRKLLPESGQPGEIVDVDGRVLGRHDGIIRFTIGQRRGLGLATGEPMFVIDLDPVGRRVVVGPRSALRTRKIILKNINWLGDRTLAEAANSGLEVHVRVRSTQMPVPAVLRSSAISADTVVVELPEGEHGVSPGQACVFYADGSLRARILGGGWIARKDGAPASRSRSPVSSGETYRGTM